MCIRLVQGSNLNNYKSVTKLGRAIGALNFLLFTELHESAAIMWTLIAVEALYCNGNGRKRQIVEKSKVITDAFEKDSLNSMYKARSSFFHGEFDFEIYPLLPSHFLSRQVLEEKHLDAALLLLFETLQYLVLNNKHDLKFKNTYTIM